ncbi:hypothetical protein SEA_GILGAMESH_156 [Streptomyces phage Gilgamesh]|uniref:Uncharacterized protein n=1 Tax=Streptomyces phage Gilgamesh TaxID=2599890 RepID=A0A5J6TSJ2_9CAUD|nr:hypothetical protein QEH35_gp156 [Streptomyces phage Gilgamesh]QFG13348.1 hypothetical protein SEA_GILGAMESH_156 [Streptomyces phage Gilgamesh]
MLPPNLTRHLYETRRLLAADSGYELAPWFALTTEQRAVAEKDMEVFRLAIDRAEEEQALLDSVAASTDTAPPLTSPAAADCPCPGCVIDAALALLLTLAQERDEQRQKPTDTGHNVFRLNLGEVTETGPGRTSTAAEKDRTRGLFEQRVTNQPIDCVLDQSTIGVWTFAPPPLTRADLDKLIKQVLRDQSRYPSVLADWATRPPTVKA